MGWLECLLRVGRTVSAAWATAGGSFWLPPPSSTVAGVVDKLFYFILAVATFFFLLIVVLMAVFVILYRRRPGVEPAGPTHNTPLEVVWSVIPLGIVVAIFYLGFKGYMDLRVPPANAYEIRVTGQKWSWVFQYPNGFVTDELHVPVDRPVLLTMTSEDVIHSLYVPAFRVKMDLVPGRYTQAWFQAVRTGQFDLYCAEYCGTGHSDMLSKVVVHPPGEFERWLDQAAKFLEQLSPAEAGELLFRRHGCGGCHSTDGTAKEGPTLQGAFGRTQTFTDGSTAVMDDNYIRQSILEPMAKVRRGYQPVMPTYKGRLSDEEITKIIEFIKSLK
ncbi:MAG TPA: cytochrome c oxidase subunit II [Planctomycetaceae bacterium]|nr:cytochrome c oxidase subunit II [Planctomycetaceae bacterium]